MSRHRSSVGLRWPSKRIAALHRLPIRSVWAARCALRCAPMAARSLRHLIRDATLAVSGHGVCAGFRIQAAMSGMSTWLIRGTTGHQSDAIFVGRYMRPHGKPANASVRCSPENT
ncbi:hypothetical protein [Verminephrobacter eiseniae]|uniref:hypothetical protein n=1 Tax=Verminephrobacter eiseniae TaxID=364317 RepID=UPI0022374DA3|nr:hypothetical protein [Verminephrobacter eiseniae]